MNDRSTLLRPPPEDPKKAQIENALEVTELAVLGPNIFTNTRQPWHPPGARGIYGGAVIAMCLAAAQRTLAPDFLVHSCHCYFLLAGASELPILFHVEQVRDGRSFATRTVQARQRGRCIFTTTISFVRDTSGGGGSTNSEEEGGEGGKATPKRKQIAEVSHASAIPRGADGLPLQPPPDDYAGEPELISQGPFQGARIEVVDVGGGDDKPGEKVTRQWVRARGKIAGGQAAQLEALAYVSDSYFIGTITRIHKLWRFPFKAEDYDQLPEDLRLKVKTLHQWEGMGEDPREMVGRPTIGMMVSLDHTIYFHEPTKVRADDWMLTEMQSPWAGDGRGVVMQKIFSKDGTLLATCVQEGLVRLQQPAPEGKESKL
ncbi:thioesterase-like superfamily-domain-containing protein [Chaetomium tenue]|uniref:Thioesterase-like superfamily-domain-containing protein n=1 Tax=Chaetomium tenue TaxID=1854479 RepID=A0ACB7P4Z8_9PEZI|nr:thioesterase-like superfamily-domain-containing protein [Chaetomium globosum]